MNDNSINVSFCRTQTPPPDDGQSGWRVDSLHWDLPSTILAVTLASSSAREEGGKTIGMTLLYYRNNYHWYLKQCWRGVGLMCLGFDKEVAGKLYLTERDHDGSTIFRTIETVWDICSTPSSVSSNSI